MNILNFLNLFKVAAIFVACLFASRVQAQSALPPSIHILHGELVSPSSAASFYGSATLHTSGLCRDYATNVDICVSGRSPEIKEITRALHGNPDLIYEYVRNSIDTEFIFGSAKGTLGALIDHSGSAFDQSALMIALLREAGYTANFKYGAITLSGSQFYAWTGLSDAKAACQFLAAGGVPANVNNSSPADCAMSGEVSVVTLAHVWVEVLIQGQAYVFDPSYKVYEHKAGSNFRGAMGLTTGQPLAAAAQNMASGSASGVSYISALNAANLNSTLTSYSAALQASLGRPKSLSDVVGGRQIAPLLLRPAGGWRQAALPYSAVVSATWSDIPDQYRATLHLATTASGGGALAAQFFTDEIYGRRLEISSLPVSGEGPLIADVWDPILLLDGVQIVAGTGLHAPTLIVNLELVADHPFAASSGTYGDLTVNKTVNYLQPATIVHAWGDVSPGLLRKWEAEQSKDRPGNVTYFSEPSDSGGVGGTGGDLLRARIAADWLGQYSRMLELQSEIANARPSPLHVLGVVSSDPAIAMSEQALAAAGGQSVGALPSAGFEVRDEVTVIDLETSLGLTSRVADSLSRRAALHAIAAASAALEASVVAQITDSPDAASTAARFAWGNAPEVGETPDATSRRVYAYGASNAAQVSGLVMVDHSAGASASYNGLPPIADTYLAIYKGRLASAVNSYASAGFSVFASEEALLGPGHRLGSEYPERTITTQNKNYRVDPTSGALVGCSTTGVCLGTGSSDWSYLSDAASIGDGNDHATLSVTAFKRLPTLQRGGALIANKYDPSGDPLEIAHVVTRFVEAAKGGGGPSMGQVARYNPAETGAVLKDRFVDRSNALGVDLASGTAGFTSPVLASVGSGEFPYRLERSVAFRSGGARPRDASDAVGELDGVVSNWDGAVTVSNSGQEAMGASLPEAAVTSIAAFAVMQDIWRAPETAQREITGELVADWWTKKLLFNVVTVQQGASAEQFVRLGDGSFAPARGGGARLTMSGDRALVRPALVVGRPQQRSDPQNQQKEALARAWKYDNLQIAVVGPQGDTRGYEFWKLGMAGPTTESAYSGFRLKSWNFPRGVSLNLAYGDLAYATKPLSVTSSLGLSLAIPLIPDETCRSSLNFANSDAKVTTVSFRGAVTGSTSVRPDASCPLAAVYEPRDTANASVSYTYDSIGRVKLAYDRLGAKGERYPHQFFFAEGYRSERIAPANGAPTTGPLPAGGIYAVEFLPAGGLSAERMTRNIDELGRVTTSLFDGRGRVIERAYPEGDKEQFTYDDRDNVVMLRKVAKASSSLASIVVTASWDTAWNKPSWVKDANGAQTDLSYVASGAGAGEIAVVQQPAVGGARPQWAYAYGANGLVSQATDPAGLVTSYGYDALGNQKSIVVDPSGLNLRTCATYDLAGNLISQTDPRAGLSACP